MSVSLRNNIKPNVKSTMKHPDSGCIGHTRHRTKTKTYNTDRKLRKMRFTDLTKPRCSRRESGPCFVWDTRHVTHYVQTFWTPLYTNTSDMNMTREIFYKQTLNSDLLSLISKLCFFLIMIGYFGYAQLITIA